MEIYIDQTIAILTVSFQRNFHLTAFTQYYITTDAFLINNILNGTFPIAIGVF